MYCSTANLSIALTRLKAYPVEHPLLLQATGELATALTLMKAHYQVRYSIFWKRSSHSIKKSIREKTNHLAFDAYTSVLRTGELLNAYVDAMEQQPPEVEDWKQIIWHLTQAARTIEKENKSEIYCRQLILFPELLQE